MPFSIEIGIGALSPTFIHLLTHTYVATISIFLPARARLSKKALDSFIERIDPATMVRIQRIRPWGTWTSSTVRLGDLRSVRHRWTIPKNLETVEGSEKWFGFGQKFYVGNAALGEKKVRAPGIWSRLEKDIKAEKFLPKTIKK